ncbi:hypothetical protein [Longispora fulva]|uniref:Uncharacterized protein n=1 Tax=Longispora fulva TaxID=619741 RepID=A0A8J7GKM2_9ACTN|nr:hypothetical protein [Longispora fulva]MBG6139916.1 hypothetical protein [Longispora fulva]
MPVTVPPQCKHPSCFDGRMERSRFTLAEVQAFSAVQLSRVEVFACPTFPGMFHTRARKGWRI